MEIGQGVLPNARLSDDVGFGRVSLSIRSCISCLRWKQLLVLWPDFWWKWQYSLRFQVGGPQLGIGVGSRGLLNHLKAKFSYAWVRVIPRLENSRLAFLV